jgi:lambda repressor-like predicted transcriptional regulator
MTDFPGEIESIRQAVKAASLADLAREAGVPYTTVHSFAEREWTHKNLETFEKLASAARRINRRKKSA